MASTGGSGPFGFLFVHPSVRALGSRLALDLNAARVFYRWFKIVGFTDDTTHRLISADSVRKLRALRDAMARHVNTVVWAAPNTWRTSHGTALRQALLVMLAILVRSVDAATPTVRLWPPNEGRVDDIMGAARALRLDLPLPFDIQSLSSIARPRGSSGRDAATAPLEEVPPDCTRAVVDMHTALLASDEVLAASFVNAGADDVVAMGYAEKGFHLRLWIGVLTNYLLHDPDFAASDSVGLAARRSGNSISNSSSSSSEEETDTLL